MYLNIYQEDCLYITSMSIDYVVRKKIYEIGYEDYINNGGVALIEWANIISEDLPKEYIRIEFKYAEKEDERIVDISYVGNKEKEEKFNVAFGN